MGCGLGFHPSRACTCHVRQVLLKSDSGFSDVAAAYSAGLKLYFVPSRESVFSGWPLEANPAWSAEMRTSLRDPPVRRRFVCALLAHLRYRAAHEDEPPPQPRVATLTAVGPRWEARLRELQEVMAVGAAGGGAGASSE